MMAEAKVKDSELTAQVKMADMQRQQQQDDREYDLRLAELDVKSRSLFVDLQKGQDAQQLLLIKLAAEKETTVEKLANELRVTVINNETQRQKVMATLEAQAREIKVKEEQGEGI